MSGSPRPPRPAMPGECTLDRMALRDEGAAVRSN